MQASFFVRSRLYRKTAFRRQTLVLAKATAVGALSLAVLTAPAQLAKRRPADKGPRALGLIRLAANGKAQLIPVTIMIDGRFYDAGAYKADPVPMALQPDIVYEGVKTGVSQGLFTITGAFHNQQQAWEGAGKWRSTADMQAEKAKSKAEAEKRSQKAPVDQDIGGPPKLKRPPQSTAQGQQSTTQNPQPQTPSPSSSPPSTGSKSPPAASSTSEKRTTSPASSSSIEDPNRPTLRHQTPETAHEQTKVGIESEPLQGPLEFIPAISDADGPEPRPYTYQLKPDEQQTLMKKMEAMAADEVRARAVHPSEENTAVKAKPGTRKSTAMPVSEFYDAQLRVFDLSSTNEPVLVFTGQAKTSYAPNLDFMVALVARQDIYGDLHKVFAQTTDDKHLDVLPRYDLIDAVDADGDGVGELLFKETGDAGSAFGVYRVIGDQLWPLFQGKPGA